MCNCTVCTPLSGRCEVRGARCEARDEELCMSYSFRDLGGVYQSQDWRFRDSGSGTASHAEREGCAHPGSPERPGANVWHPFGMDRRRLAANSSQARKNLTGQTGRTGKTDRTDRTDRTDQIDQTDPSYSPHPRLAAVNVKRLLFQQPRLQELSDFSQRLGRALVRSIRYGVP